MTAVANEWPEGNAIVYCQGAFNTTYGKTAHGLVRRSERYRVLAVIDAAWAGRDAGEVLDGRAAGIPVVSDLDAALRLRGADGRGPTHFVVGLAPDGGRLPSEARVVVAAALAAGLNVDSGLHDFLGDDPELVQLAARHGARIRDVRRTPPRPELHFFDGRISQVQALKVAVLGTDSAVGKRTTAWLLVDAFRAAGRRAELVGTGQTAWLQGAKHSLILDSLINDFVSGEIEHAVWSCWEDGRPDVIVLEGQGSLLNPAYPGGFELLAAGRPDVVVMQHAPARREYDGFPGHALHDLATQIKAIELISGREVAAITINHEELDAAGIEAARAAIRAETGLPAFDVLREGAGGLREALAPWLARADERRGRGAAGGKG
ncbi:MAG: DUF1611 domain-containing protein [bacterium]|jgi:uncharacterized NAD-dependent epimerase/dehydratase family protein|nr:DUF1611 domain-containing protein [bacterium]MBK9776809.1 DUF1611 domain-containing protein [bacterium]